MAAVYAFDAKRNLVSGRLDRIPTLDEAARALSGTGGAGPLPEGARTLWDLRDADFSSVTSASVSAYVEFRARHHHRVRSSMALVVGTAYAFGMCRMFQILSEVSGGAPEGTIGVFYTPDEALEWLSLPPPPVESTVGRSS